MQKILHQNFEQYLKYLRALLKFRTVFTEPENVRQGIGYCKKVLEENLKNYQIYFDAENNLIAMPNKVNLDKDIIYLSSHIDTVGADEKEWDSPFQPFKAFENEKEIVARGACDCKSGVAFELFWSWLAKKNLINLKNTIFTITFKEEGAGKKSAQEIAKNLGKNLPLSKKINYLMVLENNVKVSGRPILCIYTAERTNYVIKIIDFLPNLQAILQKLTHFNPVSIIPEKIFDSSKTEIFKQQGGHVCSVPREQNILTKVILAAGDNDLIKAGEEKNFASVPTEIFVAHKEKPQKHSLVLSNRSFDSLEEVKEQLKNLEYQELKDFQVSQGFDVGNKFKTDKISEILKKGEEKNLNLKIEYTYNIGGSDATTIYCSLSKNLQNKVLPIIMGPGSRSQRKAIPARLTHGKNETFDKQSGKLAVNFIAEMLVQF